MNRVCYQFFPVPVSPVIKTVEIVGATCSIAVTTFAAHPMSRRSLHKLIVPQSVP